VFVCAVVLVAFLVFSGGSGYKYTLKFENVSLIVPGNLVMVGGHPVGSVTSIELSDDNQAAMDVELDDPLREGSTFIVRKSSLSSVHSHYLSLTPGPDNAPLLAEGTTLGEASTTAAVEIDQFFDIFDERTRRGWSNLIQGAASIYAGDAAEGANKTFKYSGASFSSTQRLMAELSDQDAKLGTFVKNVGGLMTTLSEVSPTLTEAVSNANTALGAIASENESLSLALQELPPTLRQGNTTFVNLRAALDDVEPLLAANGRAADAGLAGFLRNDVTPVLRRLKPVVNAVVRALNASQEEVSESRAYSPDIFNALAKLGAAGANYDASAHYVRVRPTATGLSQLNGTTIEPADTEIYGGLDLISGINRCPGGGTQPIAGSNPFLDDGNLVGKCDPGQVP
jgi:phospholipid/cholesterol/gamma-HCH transport system substrate-binding protein